MEQLFLLIQQVYRVLNILSNYSPKESIGRIWGGMRDARPPWASKFLSIFMQFFRENLACFTPPLEGSRPPRENPGSATGKGGTARGVPPILV